MGQAVIVGQKDGLAVVFGQRVEAPANFKGARVDPGRILIDRCCLDFRLLRFQVDAAEERRWLGCVRSWSSRPSARPGRG